MIYLVDEPIKMRDPIQELNEYIDAGYLKATYYMIFTPEVLPDPSELYIRMRTGNKDAIYPIAAYCDVYTVCYGNDKAYLSPIGHNLEIDVAIGAGTTIIKQSGTVIVPKGTYDKTVNPLDIHMYERFVNETPESDFQDLLTTIREWVTDRLDVANNVYNELTKED